MNLQGNVFRELELTSEVKLFLATSYAEVGESISELYLARCKPAPAGLTQFAIHYDKQFALFHGFILLALLCVHQSHSC